MKSWKRFKITCKTSYGATNIIRVTALSKRQAKKEFRFKYPHLKFIKIEFLYTAN